MILVNTSLSKIMGSTHDGKCTNLICKDEAILKIPGSLKSAFDLRVICCPVYLCSGFPET